MLQTCACRFHYIEDWALTFYDFLQGLNLWTDGLDLFFGFGKNYF